jgi:N utilization substance protein B
MNSGFFCAHDYRILNTRINKIFEIENNPRKILFFAIEIGYGFIHFTIFGVLLTKINLLSIIKTAIIFPFFESRKRETIIMLSRRNVRVKVMQGLYTLSQDKELSYAEAVKRYRQSVDAAFDLYLYNLLLLMQIADYARTIADKKAAKLVPTAEDKAFRPKIAENDLVRSILRSDDFRRLTRMRHIDNRIDKDQVHRYYMEFAKTDDYKEYLLAPSSSKADKDILLKLYRFWVSEESFNEQMEEQFAVWLDDKSIVVGSIKKTIKALPVLDGFYEAYRPGKETVTDFGEVLFHKVHFESKELLEIIEPTLNNWDVDRVAIIDIISLKMAVTELTNFSSIPTKVTLNEFVEISKLYSTDKSKDFINGVLDRLMKELLKTGAISKEGRGLID